MLHITIPGVELWDENDQQFIVREPIDLELEHSLVSLKEWESKWHKAFLKDNDKTAEESLDYIRCMTRTPNVDPEVYYRIPPNIEQQIYEYINAPMTATVFSDDKTAKPSREVATAEVIYYWMIALNIPVEFQHWHLNSLLTLIKVCNIKNTPPKKMSKRDIMSRNAALNEARRRQLNTRG